MKCYLFIASLLLFSALLSAQMAENEPIRATVIDAETKKPLPFANIIVSGKQKGTVSNSEGAFILALEGVTSKDIVIFSYMGYDTRKIEIEELQKLSQVILHPSSIKLNEVHVTSKQLKVNEILALVRKNFSVNYPELSQKRSIFYHNYVKTPFPEENKIMLKSSDFNGLDRKTFDDLVKLMPPEFIEYQDAIADLYSSKKNHKLVPVSGVSLEEGSYKELANEIESKLSVLFDDIEKTRSEANVYYKIRSGIFSQKLEKSSTNDSIWKANRSDQQHYTIETNQVKTSILSILNDYGNYESKNWDFIRNTGKYRYKKEGITVYNDEPVFKISFQAKDRGVFEGTMYVSMLSFAVLQLDFAFAGGVQTEKFNAFGFEHAMKMKKARVIFEKGRKGYFVKYISAYQNESARVERDLSIVKKQKRFLTDKELNEIKMKLEIFFDINSTWELLVLESEEIDQKRFDEVQQPLLMKFKIEYAYTPEMWNNRTVLVPNAELKKVKRKELL